MHSHSIDDFRHAHMFLGEAHERHERKVWIVIAICAAMMAASGAGAGSARTAGIAACAVLTGRAGVVSPGPATMPGSDSRLTGSSVSAQSTPASRYKASNC